MSSSGTYDFSPSYSDIVIEALGRINIQPSSITPDHMLSARRSINLLFSKWSNRGVNLWTVDLINVPLLQGISEYDVDSSTIMILDMYLRITGSPGPIDRMMSAISRTDYASIPDKEQQAPPTSYWFDRLISPKIKIWPVPDQSYDLRYYRCTQIQDGNPSMGQTADIPYRFQEALAAGLAAQMAMTWAKDLATPLKAYADEVFAEAAAEDRERVPTSVRPVLSAYYQS